MLRTLGQAGLLGLPYAQEYGGGGQPYVVLPAGRRGTRDRVASGDGECEVHVLSCFPLATYGSSEQRERWLPEMVGGDLFGVYCLSEPQAGSDAGSLQTRAVRHGDGSAAEYVVDGVKAWITHAGVADYYNLMVRTGEPGARGISCLLAPDDTAGLTVAPRERLMGLRASPVAQVNLDGARVPADRLLGQEGQGFTIAMSAVDGGRLGIAACAVGLAHIPLDREVLGVAVAAQHLHRIGGDPHRHVAEEQFGHRRLLGVRATGVPQPGGGQVQRPPGLHPGSHVGEQERHPLEVGDHPVELPPLRWHS
jgi:alkylation response protein AidB-like acyl-CoA dehydrogenase